GLVVRRRIAGARLAAAIAALDLGSRARRAHAGAHPCLLAQPPEEPALGLLEDFELGILLIHAELVEGSIFRFLDRTAGRFHPLHALLPLALLVALVSGGRR